MELVLDRALLCVLITGGELRFQLFCQELEDTKLVDQAVELRCLSRHPSTLTREEANIQTTFGDLDGKPVVFPPGSTMRPSRRVLLLHAIASWASFCTSNPRLQIPLPTYDMDNDISGDEGTKERLKSNIIYWREAVGTVTAGLAKESLGVFQGGAGVVH